MVDKTILSFVSLSGTFRYKAVDIPPKPFSGVLAVDRTKLKSNAFSKGRSALPCIRLFPYRSVSVASASSFRFSDWSPGIVVLKKAYAPMICREKVSANMIEELVFIL